MFTNMLINIMYSKVNYLVITISLIILVFEKNNCMILDGLITIILALWFVSLIFGVFIKDMNTNISSCKYFMINIPLFISCFIGNVYAERYIFCNNITLKVLYIVIMFFVNFESFFVLIYIYYNPYRIFNNEVITQINLLKEIVYINTDEVVECGICLETLKNGVLVKKTPCGHVFDSKCIDEWVNVTKPLSKCPHCRTPLFEDNLIDNITLSITST